MHRDGHIELAKAYYSAPPEYFGREVWVRGESGVVSIINHRQEVLTLHDRAEPSRFATADAHIHAHKKSGVEPGAAYWLDRCRLIGPHTARWAEAFFAQRGVYGLRAFPGVVSLAKQHPVAAIEQAADTPTRRGAWRLRGLRRGSRPRTTSFESTSSTPIRSSGRWPLTASKLFPKYEP